MSLRVKIAGKDVKIPSDFEIAVKLQSHFFDDNREDATYPVSLNVNSNRDIFGNPDRIHSDYNQEPEASVMFGPYQILTGRAILTDVNTDDLELFITTDRHSFWGRANNTFLDTVDLGSKSFASNTAMLAEFTQSMAENSTLNYICCPLRDAFLPEAGIEQEFPFYNYLNPTAWPDKGKYEKTYKDKDCYFVPFVRLRWAIKCALKTLGYTLVSDDLTDAEYFNEILIISRRNPLHGDVSRYTLSNHVPHITLQDFLHDIENRFSCLFLANDSDKTVSITHMVSLGEMEASVLDNLSKNYILPADQITGVVYKDGDCPDSILDAYRDELSYVYGSEDNATTIECLSAVVGVGIGELAKPDVLDNSSPNFKCTYAEIRETYSDKREYDEAVSSQLRYSIYLGYMQCAIFGKYVFRYPRCAPSLKIRSTPSGPISGFSLLWTGEIGLFERYHSEKATLITGITQEHEFHLIPDMSSLLDLGAFFSKELIIRNRRYRCFEQEITLNAKRIVSHIIRCNPI